MTIASMRNGPSREGASEHPAWGARREQLAPILIWALASLLIGGIELSDNGLYLSAPLLVLAAGWLFLIGLARREPFGVRYGALFMVTATILPLFPLLEGGGLNPRFLPEQMKLMLLIFGASTIATYMTWKRLRVLAIAMPLALCFLLFFTLFSGTWDYYGVGHRFGVPSFGSPNSTAFVITVHLAMALYMASISKGVPVLSLAVSAILVGFLVATASDGGFVCGGLIALRFLGVRIKTLLYLMGISLIGSVFFALYNPGYEVPELIGSGRLYIWMHLLRELFSSGVLHILFGMGPGAIDLKPSFTQSVVSAHSMYLEVLYSYGIVGFTVMVVAIVHLGARLKRARLSPKGRTFLEAVFLALVAGAFVDTYLLTAQQVWLGALVIGFFGLAGRASDETAVGRKAKDVGGLWRRRRWARRNVGNGLVRGEPTAKPARPVP